MPYGYNGRILKVNLSEQNITFDEHPASWYRKYMGGRGIGAYYLLNELKPGIDPLGEENILVFAVSVITGVPFPGNARASVVAKSPQTGGFGDSESGGGFGPEIKFSGYDAIVFYGKSDVPVYLCINDGSVEIKDAAQLWGKTTVETRKLIKSELGDDKVQVATIGPAGESGVLYANIMGGDHNAFGRMGMGAVMGSKNLKAVAVRGTKKPEIKDNERLKEINRWFLQNFNKPETCAFFYEIGTPGAVNIHRVIGAQPSFNYSDGYIKDGDKISGEYMQEQGLMVGKTTCFACPLSCRKIVKVDSPDNLNTGGEIAGPEYESIAALGSNCGITDPKVVIKASQLCNEYGMDTISTGLTISFAMEAVQKGLLPKNILGNLPLEFGNGEALLHCIELTVQQKGIGQSLAKGSRLFAKELGPEAEDFAVQGKGQELAMQDPRGQKAGAALGYAVSFNGGDHIQMEHDFQFSQESHFLKTMEPLGVTEPIPAMDLGLDKVRFFTLNQKVWALINVLDVCLFVVAPGHTMPLPHLRDVVQASTGWETSLYELMEVAERSIVMARMFNVREGFSSKDDTIPKRLTEPYKNGVAAGAKIDPDEIKEAIKNYYEIMNWDPETGVPSMGKLKALGLEWLAD